MKAKPLSIACIAAALVAGCKVGPDYHAPATTLPSNWTAATTQPATQPASSAQSNGQDLRRWWERFEDPMLNQLVERVVEHSPDARIAAARVSEARAIRGIAGAAQQPSVNAEGAAQRVAVRNGTNLGLPHDENTLYQGGVNASWELDFFGGVKRSVEAADAGLAATEADQQAVRLALTSEVAVTYLTIRSLQERRDIAVASLADQEHTVALIAAKIKVDLARDVDLQQAQGLAAKMRSELPAYDEGIEKATFALAALLGDTPEKLLPSIRQSWSAGKHVPLAPAVPEGLPSDLLRRRPDICVAERSLAMATARIGVATADLYPKTYLLGGVGVLGLNSSSGYPYAFGGPAASWSLFNGGAVRSRIKAEGARAEQALAFYDRTVLQAVADVETAISACRRSGEREAALEQAVAANRAALADATSLYTQGLGNYLTVLDARRSLNEAEDAVAQNRLSRANSVAALCKALGGGWSVADSATDKVATKATN